MLKNTLSALIFSLVFTVFIPHSTAGQQAQNDIKFRGRIGESRFEMTLRRSGNTLNGSYFYAKSGSANTLALRGKIDASGRFTLQEFNAANNQTGEFKGTWKNNSDESGASLEGEWKKPNSTASAAQFFWASEQSIFFTNNTQITARQISETFKAKRLNVSGEYPELAGGNFGNFNLLAETMVTKWLNLFKEEMLQVSAEDLKYLPEGTNHFVDIGYNVEYADNEFISIKFQNGTYAGGAHPNTNYYALNYDLKNGREVKLADLFKPGSKYLETIAAYCLKDLQTRKIPDSDENAGLAQDMWEDGATPTPENYETFNITRKGLMITFDPYQVGPYAAGPQVVFVPYSKLKDILKSNEPFTKTAK